MQQTLFIHTDPEFNTRIRNEAGDSALIASSFPQALEWISNPEILITAVYLSPNDASHSALHFLEHAARKRPTTPIFFIDDKNEVTTEAQHQLLESISIRGLFRKNDSFEQFTSALNDRPSLLWITLDEVKKRITARKEHPGYLALPVIDLSYSKTYLLDVFVEDEKNELRLFATSGSYVEPEYLTTVAQKSSWIYVSEAQIQEAQDKIRSVQGSYVDLKAFPPSWKSAEVLFRAKTLLNEMRKKGLSDRLVEQTHFLLSDVYQIVSHLGQAERIREFIQQAKNCDHSVVCATLAILMCDALKFEKEAIVEILGLASFFQDISLSQSPFGNLRDQKIEDLSEDAKRYHFNHATHSADILAENTSLPEVTLQVIRQHHERKDRTGYPNRIGGFQLHPMAEILGLINDYLEHSLNFEEMETKIYSHYSDRIVAAFKPILSTALALKQGSPTAKKAS